LIGFVEYHIGQPSFETRVGAVDQDSLVEYEFLQPQLEVSVEDLDGAMADAGRAAVV